jgi:hypothetical protein
MRVIHFRHFAPGNRYRNWRAGPGAGGVGQYRCRVNATG